MAIFNSKAKAIRTPVHKIMCVMEVFYYKVGDLILADKRYALA